MPSIVPALIDEKGPQPGDHPGQEQDGQVGLVLADPGVALGQDLVAGRGQAHDPVAMDGARVIDEATGQDERELGSQRAPPRDLVDRPRRAVDRTHVRPARALRRRC